MFGKNYHLVINNINSLKTKCWRKEDKKANEPGLLTGDYEDPILNLNTY